MPCICQQQALNVIDTYDSDTEYSDGITSFTTTSSMETLDSVVHYQFKAQSQVPNIGRKIFYFDERRKLDSIKERYEDNYFDYTSGYTVRYNYDGTGRITEIFKNSWNNKIEHLKVLIHESYDYNESGTFTRISNIEWRTANDSSDLDVREDYLYDEYDQLDDYTMIVPPEINPDDAIYNIAYDYDSNGSLAYERKDLTEAGESKNLWETNFQNTYQEQNLPWMILATSRANGQGDWHNSGRMHFFYDDLDRKTMLTESKTLDADQVYEKRTYTYDQFNHVTQEVRYISSDSINFQLADSTLYYHSSSEVVEEDEELEEEEKDPGTTDPIEFNLYPNPTDGIVHVRSGVDVPAAISIIDASGKLVFARRYETGLADIDLSSYPDGFYIVTLTSQMGYLTGKVIKY